MSISKVSTLTSGVLAIAKDVVNNEKETLDINIIKSNPENKENILVVDVDCNKVSNYDQLVKSIYDMGFGVVISDFFTEIFSAKAANYGILTIEVSREYLDKIFKANKNNPIRLFIDLKGQEVMIISSGEKEYFEMSDYNRESFENGKDDVENLYDVWDGIDYSIKKDEVLDYAVE